MIDMTSKIDVEEGWQSRRGEVGEFFRAVDAGEVEEPAAERR
jgi:hypothetical protein